MSLDAFQIDSFENDAFQISGTAAATKVHLLIDLGGDLYLQIW